MGSGDAEEGDIEWGDSELSDAEEDIGVPYSIIVYKKAK
jgi:hypothetical protein